MRKVVSATLVVVMLGLPGAVLAQQATARPSQSAPQAQPGAVTAHQPQPRPSQQAQHQASQPQPDPPAPSPDELGISLDRVRRELRELPPITTNLLRYDFHVDVYGTNPAVNIFKDFDLSPNGPVRYGGMTHAEFLDVVTPQQYRAPSADLIGLAVWAASQLAKRRTADKSPDKQDK